MNVSSLKKKTKTAFFLKEEEKNQLNHEEKENDDKENIDPTMVPIDVMNMDMGRRSVKKEKGVKPDAISAVKSTTRSSKTPRASQKMVF